MCCECCSLISYQLLVGRDRIYVYCIYTVCFYILVIHVSTCVTNMYDGFVLSSFSAEKNTNY